MDSDLIIFWGLLIYGLTFFFVIIALLRWRVARRRERPPEPFKLLRGPGESLHKRIKAFDESMILWVLGTALGPVLLASGVVWLAAHLFPDQAGSSIWGAGTALLAGTGASGIVLYARLNRYRNDFLGYLGERAVGEYLQPLLADGYWIFHDVPADGATGSFNLDHVVVGPTGVTVVETKTRRKRPGKPGTKDHVVTFDGKELVFPWGNDRHGIRQTINNASWLRNWIKERTGLEIQVRPILTLPGWYVQETPSSKIRVVNSKILPDAIKGHHEAVLSSDQVKLIAKQLDTVCRDVED